MQLITNRPELSPEEKKISVAKYYDLPLHSMGPLQQQIVDACPVEPDRAIKAEDFLDLLQPEGYPEINYGYCMMPDGTGYIAMYSTYPNCTPEMLGWWFRWLNIPFKNQPKDTGNIKYKIWCPPDHYDHGFINGKDKTDGIWTIESLDLGAGEEMIYQIRHPFDLKEYGLTEEREQGLKEAGCWVDCCTESFHTLEPGYPQQGGTHLMITLSRQSPLGYMEKCSREWIGWGVKDGRVVRDETTPDYMLCEEYLEKVMHHATAEAQHLSLFLSQLYEEYKDKPDDED